TPSVPKIRPMRAGRSALAVLRRLAGLLQTSLLALLDARVARQEAGLLQGRAVGLFVDRVQRASDAQAQRAGLTGHAATVDASDHVERLEQTGGRESLLGDLLVQLVRQVLLERLAVDGPDAGAGDDADTRHGLLTATGRGAGSDDRGDLALRRSAGGLRRVGDALGVGGEFGLFGSGLSHDEPTLRLLGDL